MAISYLALAVGLLFAGGGGELFVRGTVGLARAVGISPGIIAATVAAFATSSPELTVAVNSSLEGAPQIALGTVLGSNIVNVALILATAVLILPIAAPRHGIRREFPVALLAPVVVGILLLDGRLSRFDGGVLLAGFVIWLVAVVLEMRRQRSAAPRVLGVAPIARAAIEGAIGLGLLIAAGRLIVFGATDIAKAFGLSDFVIGTTVVALGTSVPELATAIVSRLKRHDEVGLATILGSNIFNTLFVVGVAAAIKPIVNPVQEALPAIILGCIAIGLTFPPASAKIDRWRGGMLLAVYVLYVAAVFE